MNTWDSNIHYSVQKVFLEQSGSSVDDDTGIAKATTFPMDTLIDEMSKKNKMILMEDDNIHILRF